MHDKWHPVESGIVLAAECWQEACNQMEGLGRKPFFADRSLSRKQEIAGAKYDQQFRQKWKIG